MSAAVVGFAGNEDGVTVGVGLTGGAAGVVVSCFAGTDAAVVDVALIAVFSSLSSSLFKKSSSFSSNAGAFAALVPFVGTPKSSSRSSP